MIPKPTDISPKDVAVLAAALSAMVNLVVTAIFVGPQSYTNWILTLVFSAAFASSGISFILSVRWLRCPNFIVENSVADAKSTMEKGPENDNACEQVHGSSSSACSIMTMQDVPLQLLCSCFFGAAGWIFLPLLICLQISFIGVKTLPATALFVISAGFPAYEMIRFGKEWMRRWRRGVVQLH
ncbi:hypothetical protein BT69DRAFT_1282974 [Atractiella rhizophila]|nr:hypothetical protein BT69DRAFT_1282974 [Atractiella rhizophila]